MTTLFIILIIVASIVLSLIVLVQNPKGGGLAGNIAGFSNQFMGVKQTTDVLEKGTWIFAALIAVLCVTSAFFINSNDEDALKDINPAAAGSQQAPQQTLPNNTVTMPATPAAGDTNK